VGGPICIGKSPSAVVADLWQIDAASRFDLKAQHANRLITGH
jgi:hypothetical protein